MIVYLCTNLVSLEKYIGITSNNFFSRISQHKCNAFTRKVESHLYRAIRKDGWDAFKWEIIDQSALTFEELLLLEIFYIDKYETFINGYNMTLGGDGVLGFNHSGETKKKISQKLKGVHKGKMKQEHYQKILLINKQKLGKTYEELYGEEKAIELKKQKSLLAKELHSKNEEHKEWLYLSYEEKYGKEKALEIKSKMSEAQSNRLVNGKRSDLSEIGRLNIKNSKIGEKNHNFVKVDENAKIAIIEFYEKHGKVKKELLNQVGYSRYVVVKILKELNIYE